MTIFGHCDLWSQASVDLGKKVTVDLGKKTLKIKVLMKSKHS